MAATASLADIAEVIPQQNTASMDDVAEVMPSKPTAPAPTAAPVQTTAPKPPQQPSASAWDTVRSAKPGPGMGVVGDWGGMARRAVNAVAGPGTAIGEVVQPIINPQARNVPARSPLEAPPLVNFSAMGASKAVPPGPVRGVVQGVEDFASSMTTPTNAMIMAATGGLGVIANPAIRSGIQRLVSGGFSIDMLKSALDQSPQFVEQVQAGDLEGAARTLTNVGASAAMSSLSARHAITPARTPPPVAASAFAPTPPPPVKLPPRVTIPAPQRVRRASVMPPETGIPEAQARAEAGRQDLAPELTGKPYNALPPSERGVVDDLSRGGVSRTQSYPPPIVPVRSEQLQAAMEQAESRPTPPPSVKPKPLATPEPHTASLSDIAEVLPAKVEAPKPFEPDVVKPNPISMARAKTTSKPAESRTVPKKTGILSKEEWASSDLNHHAKLYQQYESELRNVDQWFEKNPSPDQVRTPSFKQAYEGDFGNESLRQSKILSRDEWEARGREIQQAAESSDAAEDLRRAAKLYTNQSHQSPSRAYREIVDARYRKYLKEAKAAGASLGRPLTPEPPRATMPPDVKPAAMEQGPVGEGTALPRPDAPVPPANRGRKTQVLIPGETGQYDAHYSVRELEDIAASHLGDTFQPNPRYTLKNERNYSDPSNQERVVLNSSEDRFDPRYLITDNPDLTNGPPAIDPQGNVIGGNSRAMILERVYGANKAAAQKHREALADSAANYGLDPERVRGMRNPVLVRELPEESLAMAGGRQKLVRATNKTGTAALTPSERTLADASAMSPDAIDFLQGRLDEAGPESSLREVLGSGDGASIINKMVEDGVFTMQEKPDLVDAKTGAVTDFAKKRIEQMVLGRLFRDSDQYQRTPAALRDRMLKIAAPISRLEGKGEWDLRPVVQEAVDLIEYANAHGMKNLRDAVGQEGLFGDTPKFSEQSVAVAELLQGGINPLRKAFKQFATEANLATSPEGSMFGPPDAKDAFGAAFSKSDSGVYLGAGLGALQPHIDRMTARIGQKSKTAKRWAQKEITDRYAIIKDLEKIGSVPEAESAYVAARLFHGHQGKVENRLNDFAAILRPLEQQKLLEKAMKIAEVERHEERAAKVDDYNLPRGQSLADAIAEKEGIQSGLNIRERAQVEHSMKQYRKLHERLLREMVQGDTLSQAQMDAMLSSGMKYIPMDRIFNLPDEFESMNIGSRAFSVSKQDIIHQLRAEGSRRDIRNPLESTVERISKIVPFIERNKVALRVANLSAKPEYSGIIEKLRAGNRVPPTEKVSVLRNGIKEEYRVPPEIADAMKHMSEQHVDLLTKTLAASASILRAGATSLNPVFQIANAIRDFQTATLVSSVGFTPLDWMKGFAHAVKRDAVYKDFMESGAGMSGLFQNERKASKTVARLLESPGKKVLRTVVNPVELLRLVGETIELSPRIGVFEKAGKKGQPKETASMSARNATVDFAKAGHTMRHINTWVPFLNARTQGVLNQLGAVGPKRWKSDPIGTAARITAVALLPQVVTYLNNVANYRDEWGSISQQEKDNSFIIIYGKGRDEDGNLTEAFKITKGEIQALVNPIENFLEYWRDKDSKGLAQLAVETGSNLSPIPFEEEGSVSWRRAAGALLPPAPKAVIEGVSNVNLYTGRPIVPPSMNMQFASPSNQYKPDTPKMFIEIGKATGISPLKWQNAIETQFGGLGRFGGKASDLAFGDTTALGRTGETMGKRFLGARAGAEQQRGFQVLEDVKRGEADKSVNAGRSAAQFWESVKNQPEEARRAAFERLDAAGGVTDDFVEQLNNLFERQAQGVNALERSLRGSSAAARANYLLKTLPKLSPEKREQVIDEYTEKKIITPRVIEEINRLAQ